MIELIKVHSTQIHSLTYDESSKTLVVVFHKEATPTAAYAYKDVPPAVIAGLREQSYAVGQKESDASVGKFFNEYVKKAGYQYIQIPLDLLRLERPDPSCPPGTEITVTWGEEVFCPQPYQSFRLGPFSMTTKVKEDETPAQAAERALLHLDGIARSSFAWKRDGFHVRLSESK
jgi:hypothetical protein